MGAGKIRLWFVAGLLACGSGQQPAAGPDDVPLEQTAPEEVGETASPTADIEWAAMNEAQRKQYMKDVVHPKMRSLFQAAAPDEYAEFTCATCHGSSAERGSFEMPSPDLPPLNAKDGFQQLQQEQPEIFEFMAKQVVPEMAALLGVQPYDPATQQGFGCFHCHTAEE